MDPRLSGGWIGTVLNNKFRIDAKIARGGVATVFKASERGGGPSVAVKIMHPEYCRNEDARGRFLREGYAANKVGHPGVVRVKEDGSTPDGSVYLVMELLEDGELLETKRERLGGNMPPDEVTRIGDQLLDVLGAAHDQGIIHRDIKPENIFILTDGTVRVLDFGIAHIKDAVARAEPTATGLLLGTPDFMSPEQAQGMRGTIDAQTDVYAVGATMFTLLSGEAVHTEQALGSLLHATASKQARSLATSRAKDGIPPSLIAVVDKALMLLKPQRWQSARAMQDALRKAMPDALSKQPKPLAPRVGIAGARNSVKPQSPLPTGTPRDGVRAIVTKPPRPAMDDPKPPSDRTVMQAPDDAWMKPFADGEMEGATVALNDAPPKPRPATYEEQAATQALDPLSLPLPPPPRTPSLSPPAPSFPPSPISLPPPTPPMHTLPQPTQPLPSPQQQQQQYANPQMSTRQRPSMAPPPGHHSMPPPPPQYPSFAPPPPATPRGQPWSPNDSSQVAIAPSAPLQPKMIPTAASKPPKPPSILIAEIVLAALVIITLTIGGCLLVRSK